MTQLLSAVAKLRQSHITAQQTAIRQHFQPFNSPFYYITYSDFCNNFEVHAGKNFKEENLNIIDTHLKYRQWCYEEMAPYKWTPIILWAVMRMVRLRRPPLILPYVYTQLFDFYMEPFFVWLHKDDKLVNVRYQFATKLSKVKNKERRVQLFKNLQKSLKRQDQLKTQPPKQPIIPHKYIKFGFPSQYVFHAQVDGIEMSTILQTTFFETYLQFRYPTMDSFKQLFGHFLKLKEKFKEFKKDEQREKYCLNLKDFMRFKDINEGQISQLSSLIEKRVRRWQQTLMYDRKNTIYYSNWTLDKLIYQYEHKHMTDQPKYSIEQNSADLFLYYSAILIPTVLLKFFRR